MKNIISTTLLSIALFLPCGCGVGALRSGDDANLGQVRLSVSHSKGVGEGQGYAKIKKYRVTVTGNGIIVPIIAEFDGTAVGGTVGDVPSGVDRTVSVEAINPKDKLIRLGVADGVSVVGGGSAEVLVELQAVPIFVNVDDGNVVVSNRLRFHLYSDPGDQLEILDSFEGADQTLHDISTGSAAVLADIQSGSATLVPTGIGYGSHTFVARSLQTGHQSSVTITVMDGSLIGGAPLYTSSTFELSDEGLQLRQIGRPFAVRSGNRGDL